MAKVRIEDIENFYETMSEWFSQHGWPPIDINALPEKVFVSNNGDNDTYCCCLYETDSDFGFVAFPLSNKKVKRDREDLMNIFSTIEEYAKSVGIKILFTTSGTVAVETSLIDSGYKLGDINVNQYIKWVKQ